ncbi:glycosyltransferase family 4 protein [Gammaproteobacteria bacterium]|nr:glycosyltransferase family 4 protein [Gammaproteobacteria bacterium]
MPSLKNIELIIGNSGRNFSGGTSITIQLLGYQVKEINLAVLGSRFIPTQYKTINYLQFLSLTRRKLPNGKPRVFYTRKNNEMIQGLLAKYIFGAKIKIIFSSSAQRDHTKFTKWLMSKMDSIVSTSRKAGNYLNKEPDKIISHGIDLNRFSPPKDKDKAWQILGFPGSIGIGIFGRVRYSKGIDILVDAALEVLPKHPRATVIICGEVQIEDQSYKNNMLRKITDANLEDRILFLGKKPFEDLPKLFQGMSVVAALSRNEGYGLTPLEGMASGAAVLTSSEGVWDELVRDGIDGYVVKTDDVFQTAERLNTLIENSSKTKIMGENAAKYILENFSIEREAKQIIQHIRDVQNI